jgi:uncharacterized protein
MSAAPAAARPGPDPAWPYRTLDVAALRREGIRPVPLRQFVLKVHTRCNLACTYCYLYQGPDDTWRRRPARVPERTVRSTALRIAEHARAHGTREIRVELHGGEPLLGGPGPVVDYARAVRDAVPADCRVTASVQTNGTLLDRGALEALDAADIRIGLSLDGGGAGTNSRRVDHAGRPSWQAAVRAAGLLARHPRPETFAGILCTVDLAADPSEVYTSLLRLGPPAVDFLLPHANWTTLPPGLVRDHRGTTPGRSPRHLRPTPYGDWLARVFDLWWDGDRMQTRVRLFSQIVGLLLGVPATAESVGLSPMAAVVIDTDGAIEQVDSLRSAYAGASATGLDVFRNSFDQALEHPGLAARQIGERGLAPDCRSCPVLRVCGGGNYAHRFAAGSGFLHPSVYCADLEKLIRHIADRLRRVSGTRAATRNVQM